MKERLMWILKKDVNPTVKFEILEKFFHYVDCDQDIDFLIELFDTEVDACVLHEISAQLFRIEEKKPDIMRSKKKVVIEKLLYRSINDDSVVVRHESIEALGYLGDESCLEILDALKNDQNSDIKSTAHIAFENTFVRLKFNLKASELCDFYIKQYEVA